MNDPFRFWFLLLYVFGFSVFLIELYRFRARQPAVERQTGLLPPPPGVINWLIALAVLFTRVGELDRGWPVLRLLGLCLSLYFLVVVPWATRTIGRSYVPGAAVLDDHQLITAGPFRFVRHPIYSGVVVLWLGAALGTLNWVMLALWPLLILGILREARLEEELLRGKFGDAYETYAKGRGRLLPRLPG